MTVDGQEFVFAKLHGPGKPPSRDRRNAGAEANIFQEGGVKRRMARHGRQLIYML